MEERREFPLQVTDDSSEALFHSRRRCCFSFPCFDRNSYSSPATGLSEVERSNDSLWKRGMMKIREWSEIVAGPKWKTFIRRFNQNRSGNINQVNFQYDPLSYAMNFDDGPGQSGHIEEEDVDGYYYASRNFSSRYAKGSMDLGRDGPSFI